MMGERVSRREFLQQGSSLALAAGLVGSDALAAGVERPIREFRRGGMLYRRLGQTDLFVSSLSFGSHTDPTYKKTAKHGHMLSEEGQARRDRRISKALDLGVNMVDTYENEGQLEPMARLARPRRDKVLVSLCRQLPGFLGKKIDDAARLFGHVDLYRIYLGDMSKVDEPTLEDWDAMRKAKKTGKVRALGIATHSERTMLTAVEELEGLDYIMFPYNFIHARASYSRFLPTAIKKGIGLIAIKPLAAGSIVKLDPRARAGTKPENSRIEIYRASNRPILPAVAEKLTRSLNRLPDESLCQAALRFVYSRSFITCAMPGMFREHELSENFTALQRHLNLSGDERAALDAARELSTAYGSAWLPSHYRWLDRHWRA